MFPFRSFGFNVDVNVDLGVDRVFRVQVFVNGRLLPLFGLPNSKFFHFTMFKVRYLIVAVYATPRPLHSVTIKAYGAHVRECLLCLMEGVFFRGRDGLIMWERQDQFDREVLYFYGRCGCAGGIVRGDYCPLFSMSSPPCGSLGLCRGAWCRAIGHAVNIG